MESFKNWLLTEMPIQLTKIGGWKEKDRPYGFKKDDIGIMNNERGLAKIALKWSKVPENFNTYVCRSSNCFKQMEIGEVDENFVQNVLKLKIVSNPTQPDEIHIDPNSINYIITNNRGDERMPLNAWTIAHRFGHALARQNDGAAHKAFKDVERNFNLDISRMIDGCFGVKLNNYTVERANQQSILKSVLTAIGTMGSARKNQLRNPFEFLFELIAQYIITGNIKFNPLPRNLKYYKNSYDYDGNRKNGSFSYLFVKDNDNLENWNEYLEDTFPEMMVEYIKRMLEICVGKIFVM